ncbi:MULTISPECIES: hypothetical protein [Streptomonospora]|uniref:Uncharacterized protein n=1 Tax=Streptomonospora arabica TaxID=412417 RepID=A0ABV9STI2_9ACTN
MGIYQHSIHSKIAADNSLRVFHGSAVEQLQPHRRPQRLHHGIGPAASLTDSSSTAELGDPVLQAETADTEGFGEPDG